MRVPDRYVNAESHSLRGMSSGSLGALQLREQHPNVDTFGSEDRPNTGGHSDLLTNDTRTESSTRNDP